MWLFGFGGQDMERLVADRECIYLDRFWNEFPGTRTGLMKRSASKTLLQEHRVHQQDEADERDRSDVVQRVLDVTGRPVDVRIDADALEARGHVSQRVLKAPGDLEGAGAGNLPTTR
jgi:hypothetical protein